MRVALTSVFSGDTDFVDYSYVGGIDKWDVWAFTRKRRVDTFWDVMLIDTTAVGRSGKVFLSLDLTLGKGQPISLRAAQVRSLIEVKEALCETPEDTPEKWETLIAMLACFAPHLLKGNLNPEVKAVLKKIKEGQ